jgi:thymidylate synthase
MLLTNYDLSSVDMVSLFLCHFIAHYYVTEANNEKKLNAKGLVVLDFVLAIYSLLIKMLARVCNMSVEEFILSTSNTHIYKTTRKTNKVLFFFQLLFLKNK